MTAIDVTRKRLDSLPSAAELGLHTLLHLDSVTSTMDEAHARARAGAPAGLLVVADEQTAGRGRSGHRWASDAERGLWMTLLERPADAAMLRVLSLRVGLAIARAAEPLAAGPVLVKWPNDLYTSAGKLGGILIEARWREEVVDWVAIGIGINVRAPAGMPHAASLRAGTTRADLLRRVVPAIRAAVQGPATLDVDELAEWHRRDFAVGRRIVAPVAGTVQGIRADGALLVRESEAPTLTSVHAGSMVFDDRERAC
jgi:BirA family biotin operon repressor/biotin-[acetyl-CoA-carboxylase] ligase